MEVTDPPVSGSMRNVWRASEVALLARTPVLLPLQLKLALSDLMLVGVIRVESQSIPGCAGLEFTCVVASIRPSRLSTRMVAACSCTVMAADAFLLGSA